MRLGSAFVLAAAAALASLHAQVDPARPAAADWPMYNRDLAGTRYSPLTQINAGTVARLSRAWSYTLGRDKTAGTLSGGSEFTPTASSVRRRVFSGRKAIRARAISWAPSAAAALGTLLWAASTAGSASGRRGARSWP